MVGGLKDGLVSPQAGLVMADLLEKCILFSLGCSNWLQITKNKFLRFWAFYPLISAFQAFPCISQDRSRKDLSFRIKKS